MKKLLAFVILAAVLGGCAIYQGSLPPSSDGLYIFVPGTRPASTQPAPDPNDYQ